MANPDAAAQVTTNAAAATVATTPVAATAAPVTTTAGTATPPPAAPAAAAATEEKKPAGTLLGGEVGKEAEVKVPIRYDLKLPKDSSMVPTALEGIGAFARDLGLSQEQAQKLVEHNSTVIAEHEKSQVEMLQKQSETWVEELKSDKDFGGNKFTENVAVAARVVEKYGSPALKAALNETGLGNHPELLKMFRKIGEAFKDDKTFIQKAGAIPTKQKTPQEVLYGQGGPEEQSTG